MTTDATIVLHITDLHLRAAAGARLLGVDTADSLRAVLEQACAEYTPHAVLATGDIAHDPEPASYARFVDLLAGFYRGPLMVLPGNHDLTAAMTEVMTAVMTQPAVLNLPGWAVLGLDSHADDRVEASVSTDELEVLRARCIAAAGSHVLLATHHPPVAVGSPWLDKDRIQNAAELLDWAAEQGTVRGMVFGHAHQEIDTTHRNLRLLGTPATCFQFAPFTQRFTIDQAMPGYRWLFLGRDGSMATQVRRVRDYPLRIDLAQRASS